MMFIKRKKKEKKENEEKKRKKKKKKKKEVNQTISQKTDQKSIISKTNNYNDNYKLNQRRVTITIFLIILKPTFPTSS